MYIIIFLEVFFKFLFVLFKKSWTSLWEKLRSTSGTTIRFGLIYVSLRVRLESQNNRRLNNQVRRICRIPQCWTLQEPVPSNSGNLIVVERKNPTQHWSKSVNSRNYPKFLGTPTNSGIPRNQSNSGIARKCMRLHGIPGNSYWFRNCGYSVHSGIPDRDYIASSPSSILMCLPFNRFD
jgi:hypothetical protein